MARIAERNGQAPLDRRRAEEARNSDQDRLADSITAFVGSIRLVFIDRILFGGWVFWNLGWLGLRPFDPSFAILATVASMAAIFQSTFVLISQDRMAAFADKRADLDLQVSLLAEHKITRLIILTTGIARKMNISQANDPDIPESATDVRPEKVLDSLERQ